MQQKKNCKNKIVWTRSTENSSAKLNSAGKKSQTFIISPLFWVPLQNLCINEIQNTQHNN